MTQVASDAPPPNWLTREDVAARMQIAPKTLAKWASLGKGPRYAKFGGICRYRLADVIAWEEEQLTGGETA